MNKRYQVFVSSTYEDLIEERQKVMQSLLELDCIPTGMELFPATDDDSWTHIQRFIKECDYYVVIVGGRYGSKGPIGKSYTEMEYDYAGEVGLPRLAFLHKNPGSIAAGKSEKHDEGKAALTAFRTKIEDARHAKYWSDPSDLALRVTSGMNSMMKLKPGIGWVRGDKVPDESTAQEILNLRNRVDELQKLIDDPKPPESAEGLAQGEENFRVRFQYGEELESELFSWNQLIALWGPLLIVGETEEGLREALRSEYRNRRRDKNQKYNSSLYARLADLQQVKLQLRALGIIRESEQGRWKLTPYGDKLVMQVGALQSRKRNSGEPT